MDEQEQNYKKQCEDFRRQIENLKKENEKAVQFMSEDLQDSDKDDEFSGLPTPLLTPQTSFSDIPQDYQQKALEKLYANVLSQKLITSLDWSTKFSGDGMSAEDILNYRKKVQNWFKLGKETMGWSIELGIRKILAKMTGTAEKFAQTTEAMELKSEEQFFSWFDITFNVAALRKQLYLECKSFKLPDNITVEQVVPQFNMKYSLLAQTTQFINPIIKKNTTLTVQQQIEAIEFALKPTWKQTYDTYTIMSASTPTTMKELQNRLKMIALAIQLTNKNNTNITPNPTTINSNINTNDNNSNSINTMQSNGKFDQFNNNNNNNYYQYRGRNRRGRGGYRGRNGRGRGRYRQNNNNTSNSKYYPPSYHHNWGRMCPKCKKYGHLPTACHKIHKFYADLVPIFDKTYRDNNPQKFNKQLNNIQANETKSKSNNTNDNQSNKSNQNNNTNNIQSRISNLPHNTSFVPSIFDTQKKQ